eukprot:5589926-Amphidinium_carterae.1
MPATCGILVQQYPSPPRLEKSPYINWGGTSAMPSKLRTLRWFEYATTPVSGPRTGAEIFP